MHTVHSTRTLVHTIMLVCHFFFFFFFVSQSAIVLNVYALFDGLLIIFLWNQYKDFFSLFVFIFWFETFYLCAVSTQTTECQPAYSFNSNTLILPQDSFACLAYYSFAYSTMYIT